MTSKMSNVFEKRIEEIFKEYEITQYREDRRRGWVEFYWEHKIECGNELHLSKILAISALLRTINITINAWTESDGCKSCGSERNYGYLVAYDVVGLKRR